MNRRIASLVVALSALSARPAAAEFHLMKIVEVFPGTVGSPNAQYVRLQMFSGGQNLVSTHKVIVFDASGAMIATSTFTQKVPNGLNQASILIATTQAETLFNIPADLTLAGTLPRAGGKVCFDAIDCVSWGNYTGNPTGVGRPAMQALGLIQGRSLMRRLDIAGGAGTLEDADDTNDSANDFVIAVPTPRNNPSAIGTLPPSTCGNNTIEGLETCDDNNTASNDGCSSDCVTEACGDGIVQSAEQCDDKNTVDNDACSNTCSVSSGGDTGGGDGPPADGPPADGPPADGPPNPGNDSGNPETGDGGGGGCCQTGGASSAWLSVGVLGMLLRKRRRLVR